MHRTVWLWVGCIAVATSACGGGDSNNRSGDATTTTTGSGSTTTGEGGATSASTTTSVSSGGGDGGGGSSTTGATTGAGGNGAGGSGVGGSGVGGSGTGTGGTGGAGTGGAGGAPECQTNADCSDNNFCNGDEVCNAGACEPAPTGADCADAIDCTVDLCDPMLDQCTHTSSNALCDNNLFCDGTEACDPANGDPVTGCLPGGGTPCDDTVQCTVDSCDEANDTCLYVPTDALCDTSFCAGSETCGMLGCISNGLPSCADGVNCTSDFCDQVADACAHVPDDTACSNNAFCDGIESCDVALGCQPGQPVNCSDGIPCTTDGCNEANDTCTHVAVNAACADNSFCNGVETCDMQAGCQSGNPVVCNDGRSCTADTCSDQAQSCVFSPNNAACDDGAACNGVETCSGNGPAPSGCVAGVPIPCPPDNIACTVDACDEATDSCKHTADNTLCGPGQFCVVQQNGCTSGQPCQNAGQCQDNTLCNGAETCTNGICQPGNPVDCEDFVGCTVDSCNPQTGVCSHVADNAACDDGFACGGVETCHPVNGCQPGVPVNCNDGVACTQDLCSDPAGTCSHFAQNAACSDGNLCNGVEVCNAQTGCQPSQSPFVCPDDGIACTTQFCDPALNQCTSVPNNALCPCGQTCSVQNGGCGSFCQVATCQGKVYQCGDCLDNDGDCAIDSSDSMCLGPCDDSENSYAIAIPGANNAPCKQDCFFDGDTGAGNDDCYWSHKCDPLEVAPNFPPEGSQCQYNPNANIPGYNGTCSVAFQTQSTECHDYCGPLTPNGCDCFGCCEIPGAPTTVWLGSENGNGFSCNVASVGNPALCEPCTQVVACLNTCAHCELCVGKPTLPPDCVTQICPPGVQECGLPGQASCADGSSCITGCCQLNPE